MVKKLPNKLSSLIRVALDDLHKVENDPKFRVDMSDWYHSNSHCAVCFAGGVMAFSLGKGANGGHQYPENFGRQNEGKLVAIDQCRIGDFSSALDEMRDHGCDWITDEHIAKAERVDRFVVGYDRSKREFKAQMRKAAIELRSLGL